MNPRRVLLAFLVLALIAGALTACKSHSKQRESPPLSARLFLEARPDEAGMPVQLPVSGVSISVGAKPVFFEYDVVNAEVARVELGKCLMLQLSADATRDLYRLSVQAMGRRLVLALDNQFVGARRIDRAIADGALMFFVEVPDAELPGLVARLKETSAEIAKAAGKRGR